MGRKSEEREFAQMGGIDLRLALEAWPAAVSIHAPDGKILFANQKLAELTGRLAQELPGETCEHLFHETFSGCPHETALAERRAVKREAKDAAGGRWLVTVTPLIESGKLRGYAREVRDMTAEVAARESLLRAEQYATLGQMMASLTHEIGTPLNIISGYCEYLLMKLTEDAAGYKELSTILEQTRRISNYLRQALDLGRGPQSHDESFSVQGLIEEVLELLGYHLRRQKVVAGLVCEPGLGPLVGDATRLRQAFFNLLMNIASRAGEGARLEIGVAANGAHSETITIQIRGEDAAGANLDFAEFSRGGGGLGLALAQAIFAESGARLQKEPGEGPGGLLIELPKRAPAKGD